MSEIRNYLVANPIDSSLENDLRATRTELKPKILIRKTKIGRIW